MQKYFLKKSLDFILNFSNLKTKKINKFKMLGYCIIFYNYLLRKGNLKPKLILNKKIGNFFEINLRQYVTNNLYSKKFLNIFLNEKEFGIFLNEIEQIVSNFTKENNEKNFIQQVLEKLILRKDFIGIMQNYNQPIGIEVLENLCLIKSKEN